MCAPAHSSLSTRPRAAGIIAAATGALLNLLGITILSLLYNGLAVRMTNWENHRKVGTGVWGSMRD